RAARLLRRQLAHSEAPLPLDSERRDEMSALAFDVAAVRRRFSALDAPLVFLDAPGGTQVPDEVVDAIAGYLREANANSGGPFETSRRTDAVLAQARLAAAEFLGCDPDEAIFGTNM